MTATHTHTQPAGNHTPGKSCCCGCGAPEGACCKLTCLVQPKFFCGQLLTDQDLSAMIAWAKGRLALARYRHGWGVVCGLDVHCHPTDSASIVVGSGYAVNCCGADILVCEDTPYSLEAYCRPDDLCGEFRKPGEADSKVELGVVRVPESEIRILDLYIDYREEGSEPVTALGRASCTATPSCENSRTHETFSLSVKMGPAGADPVATAARLWAEEYVKCLDVIKQYRKAGIPLGKGEPHRQWFVNWLDNHPLHHFCWLRDWLCDKDTATDLSGEAMVARVLFYLLLDCRLSFLNCGCAECYDSPGVPLARIWLRTAAGAKGKRICRVLNIDPYPPYRRPISMDCWPAPMGHVNLGPAIWHRPDDARQILTGLGVRVEKDAAYDLPSIEKLADSLSGDLFVEKGGTRRMQVFDAGELGRRVVGFMG